MQPRDRDVADAYLPELRATLIDQIAYVGDEVEALRAVISRVPQPVLEGRPLASDRSIKELFGLLAARDRRMRLPFVQQVVAEDDPTLDAVDEDALLESSAWNERRIGDILDEVAAARSELVDALEALPEDAWKRGGSRDGEQQTLYALAHAATQEDNDVLRAVTMRLHDSNLSGRAQPAPQ